MSHQIGAKFHLSHGLINAVLLPYVIAYNASDRPTRMAYYPTYTHAEAGGRYADLARSLGCHGDSNEDLVQCLIVKFRDLASALDVPATFKELGISEAKYMACIDEMADNAFDDQCTGANPRLPLKDELLALYRQAYHGGKSREVVTQAFFQNICQRVRKGRVSFCPILFIFYLFLKGICDSCRSPGGVDCLVLQCHHVLHYIFPMSIQSVFILPYTFTHCALFLLVLVCHKHVYIVGIVKQMPTCNYFCYNLIF